MRERPILFSGPMVRALLAGTKTQTRRIIEPQPVHEQFYAYKGETLYDAEHRLWWWKRHSFENLIDFEYGRGDLAKLCPKAQPGDRLWVREAWRTVESLDERRPATLDERVPIRYEADGQTRGRPIREPLGRYRHARFMPRWASRITLEVTDVRVERLHDISELDALAEGVEGRAVESVLDGTPGEYIVGSARDAYADLWREINGADSWDANPFVWVIEFPPFKAASEAAA